MQVVYSFKALHKNGIQFPITVRRYSYRRWYSEKGRQRWDILVKYNSTTREYTVTCNGDCIAIERGKVSLKNEVVWWFPEEL